MFADWNISGPHTLRAQYVLANDTEGNSTVGIGSYVAPATFGSDTGADLMAIFYSYALSKRTEVSVGYSQLSSDDNAAFSKGKTAVTLGGSQKNYGLVVRHRF